MIDLKAKKFSKVIIKSDKSSWVLDELKKEIEFSLKNKINFINQNFNYFIKGQCIFYINKYDLIREKNKNNNIAVSFFHIDPKKKKENKNILDYLINNKFIKCIQVTNKKMESYLIKKGIKKKKIFKIPIGIDIKKFPYVSIKKKMALKKKKGLEDYFVIGSFQKDGIGWGDGNRPKMIKGPDLFIKIIKKLKKKLNLHVILTGPSRGYVINNLKKLNVSYQHHYLKKYEELKNYYSLLDAYIVSSREEGGPRAILESMSSGVPIYSTRVGQAPEVIKNGYNGFLFDINKYDKLINLIIKNFKNNKTKLKIVRNAKNTAKNFSYYKNKKLWTNFFECLKKK